MLKLPFAPTDAQSRAFMEIEGDMAQPVPMLRLLQGDVGSGKTLVALMALLKTVEAGAPGAMLATTEILDLQHPEQLPVMATGLPSSTERRVGDEWVRTGRSRGVP